MPSAVSAAARARSFCLPDVVVLSCVNSTRLNGIVGDVDVEDVETYRLIIMSAGVCVFAHSHPVYSFHSRPIYKYAN